jgi:probable phosphoglycerate mutase
MISAAARLCLVRHGETAWNMERRIQGQLDVPLNATGTAQARALANTLRHERFEAIYASDLSRARHTADAVAHVLRLPVTPEAGLRERSFGIYQNLTHAEWRSRHPEDYARFERRDAAHVLPGGESLGQFAARALDCVARLAARHPGGQVLLVTHRGVLDAVYRRATGRALEARRDLEVPNAALNWIEIEGPRWTLLGWADRAHLTDALDELQG